MAMLSITTIRKALAHRMMVSMAIFIPIGILHALFVGPSVNAMNDLPLLPDALFDWIPHLPLAGYIANIAVYLSIIFYLRSARHTRGLVPYSVALFTMIIFGHSVCVLVNPTLPPLGVSQPYSLSSHASIPSLFSSIPIAVTFAFGLLLPRFRPQFIGLSILVAVSFIASRDHYTVDVIGGFAIGWCCYSAGERWLRGWYGVHSYGDGANDEVQSAPKAPRLVVIPGGLSRQRKSDSTCRL